MKQRHLYQLLHRTVADSGASVVSGQGTSGTAVRWGTETVSATPATVATNAQSHQPIPQRPKQVKKPVLFLTNANQVTPAVPVQAETVMSLLMRGRPLECRFCQQQTFIPTWLTMTIIKISRLKQLVCLKLPSYQKLVKLIQIRVLVDSGDTIQGTPLELIRPWFCCPRWDSPYVQGFSRCLGMTPKRLKPRV